MKKRILCVIDAQNDFIDGSLGTPEAQAIIPNVEKKIEQYINNGEQIYVTQDTHYENYFETNEGRHLPIKHCIANSDGWQLNDDIYNSLKTANVDYTLKHTFGSLELVNKLMEVIPKYKEDQEQCYIELIGLCLDVCVISNAVLIKTQFPNSNVSINMNCTAATTPDKFYMTKNILGSLQIEENYE